MAIRIRNYHIFRCKLFSKTEILSSGSPLLYEGRVVAVVNGGYPCAAG